MKKALTALLAVLALFALNLPAAGKAAKNPVLDSDTLIWAGLDYSKVRMVGPGQFTNPETIFPDMLNAWNQLFLRERLGFVGRITKKQVIPDTEGMAEINKAATAKQIITAVTPEDTINKSHITQQDIAQCVKAYKLNNKSGLGVAFIVDRFVKFDPKGQGAVYVVAFDIATREVLFTKREVHTAAGFGFRNYWFRVIKDSEEALKKLK